MAIPAQLTWYEDASNPPTSPDIRPCIIELLRTGYHPPELVLRVERVIDVPIVLSQPVDRLPEPSSLIAPETHDDVVIPTRRTYRLFLGDGEYTIQALLRQELHFFVATREVKPGAVLALERYETRKADRIADPAGYNYKGPCSPKPIVYLAVERFRTLNREQLRSDEPLHDEIEIGLPIIKAVSVEKYSGKHTLDNQDMGSQSPSKTPKLLVRTSKAVNELEERDISPLLDGTIKKLGGDVETNILLDASENHICMPEEVRELPSHHQCCEGGKPKSQLSPSKCNHNSTAIDGPITSIKDPTKHFNVRSEAIQARMLLPTTQPINVLPIHALLQPQHPLPKRNYIVDIFGIISWISPTVITRRNMPPKRDLRVIDPSFIHHPYQNKHPNNTKLGLGISVSIFVNAEQFCPPVGTVALFRNLKTHEWEGISLNAYEKDCGGGKEWFVSDSGRLKSFGYDVVGIRAWWDGWCAMRKNAKGEIGEEAPTSEHIHLFENSIVI
ncbi:hypothetical protein LOZ39_000270 [Ophidiomyces ophidiicola]|nr:hypothetical protein LOZ64_003687 [Ophidiomyces ophidiicola]KAI1916687.1 hypothetical protein LOZ61_000957 [Ophidiomyces ophidiicola]KAI1928035.1 hypothetical protein LOZ60_002656 [Ophidiomyces ophidiicola]KAI1964302.1 hypothetical protein LOZ59_001605 [Ophidiomyces ophidiicola]KAI2009578.1 hypothetical protein LOZ49_003852 [Ophidiomyces ophidiicola]